IVFSALLLACSSDEKKIDPVPDANVTGPCAEYDSPVFTATSYPATYSGNLLGAGDDHSVAEGSCSDERSFYAQEGEDEVIKLSGLTVGERYGIILNSDDDLSFYLTAGCADSVVGACKLFVDQEARREASEFTADSDTAYLVIDHFGNDPVQSGNYSLSVVRATCLAPSECDSTAPFCFDFGCVECVNSFQCSNSAKPACDQDSHACVTGWDECTGDDPSPPEPGDDGPLGAATLADPGLGTPTIVSQNICSAPLSEVDFFEITLPANAKRVFSVAWAAGSGDIDLVLLREDGSVVDSSIRSQPEAISVDGIAPGKYYLAVTKFESAGNPLKIAIPYTLSASVPECETSFDCSNPALPVCAATRLCSVSSSDCTGDDASEENDGPTTATTLSSGTIVNANICNVPNSESDFYKIDVSAGEGLDVLVSFDGANAADLDVQVFDAAGVSLGFTLWSNPERVTLSYLPAGSYFIEVQYFSSGSVIAAHPYTIAATRIPGAGCQNNSDCDDEFKTQVFRGDCNPGTGACSAIAGNGVRAIGTPCDSGDDCSSGQCSVLLFQENAAESVCTVSCSSDAQCVTAHGSGFRCTVPFANNFCHPDCSGLECGVNQISSNLDQGQPWDYLTCNAGACEVDN
ncbi:MAG: PPC domain-containing protein, partial [Kofleriaceae bacterium]|nr:PPC domain-containing protein [Kofleriaceae bacterium]